MSKKKNCNPCGSGGSSGNLFSQGGFRPRAVSFSLNGTILTINREDNSSFSIDLLSLTAGGGGGGVGNYNPLVDLATQMGYDLGGLLQGTTAGDLQGLSFSQLFDLLLFAATPPVYVGPTAALNQGTPAVLAINRVGVPIDPILVGSFVQNNAGAITSYTLTKNNAFLSNNTSFTDTAVLNIPGIITYQGTFNYADGPILPDSQGNPDPTGQILAGSINTNSLVFRWNYPLYFGLTTTPLSIDVVADATATQLAANYNTSTVSFNSTSSDYLWIAVPDVTPTFNSWFVTPLNQGAIGTPLDLFDAPQIIQVTDTNFVNINYKLYVSTFSTAVSQPMTFS
jgi:hypothetical protein